MAAYEDPEEIPGLIEKDRVTSEAIQIVLKLFEEEYKFYEQFSNGGTVKFPDESFLMLDVIFGEVLEKALELVETNSVRYFHLNKESIGIFRVDGQLQSSYTVFPNINYCSCTAYKYQVAAGSFLTCKHVLASAIAKIMGKVKSAEITPSQYYDLLLESAVINEHKSSKMNKREDWRDENRYTEQFLYPPSEIPTGFLHANNWVHVPPQTMPWGLPSTSHPPVVRFTAGDYVPQHQPVKRKMNIDFEVRSAKQLVTEEKMAAHMSNLHISDVELPCVNAEDEAMDTDRLPKLVVCDEVKNLKTEPIIPESLLNKIERPKMAVVLWQPPGDDLVSKLTEITKENAKVNDKEEKEENAMIIENNNIDNTFRPIDPVPMHSAPQDNYLQPMPQFQGYFPLP